jgi:hypothetical protein
MADQKFLTRKQIADFVGNDPETIRAIERLFLVTDQLAPNDIAIINTAIQDNALALGAAQVQAEVLTSLLKLADTVQGLALAPPIQPERRRVYGTFYDTSTQTAAAIDTAYTVSFSSTDLSSGVYLSGSQITVSQAGWYNFQHSIQIDKTTAGKGLFQLWYALNGSDVAESARRVRIEGSNSEGVASGNYVFRLKANDYIQLKWAVNDTGVTISRFAAAPPVPAVPSAIVTVSDNAGA